MDKEIKIPLLNLTKARENKMYSQNKLAEIVGTNNVQLSRIEKGYQMPKAEMLIKLSLALDVSIDYLLEDLKKDVIANKDKYYITAGKDKFKNKRGN